MARRIAGARRRPVVGPDEAATPDDPQVPAQQVDDALAMALAARDEYLRRRGATETPETEAVPGPSSVPVAMLKPVSEGKGRPSRRATVESPSEPSGPEDSQLPERVQELRGFVVSMVADLPLEHRGIALQMLKDLSLAPAPAKKWLTYSGVRLVPVHQPPQTAPVAGGADVADAAPADSPPAARVRPRTREEQRPRGRRVDVTAEGFNPDNPFAQFQQPSVVLNEPLKTGAPRQRSGHSLRQTWKRDGNGRLKPPEQRDDQ